MMVDAILCDNPGLMLCGWCRDIAFLEGGFINNKVRKASNQLVVLRSHQPGL